MKESEKMKRYFEVLEVDSDASFADVESSYRLLKELYSGNNIAIAPLDEELGEEGRAEILNNIEEAYRHVVALTRKGATPTSDLSGVRGFVPEDEINAFIDAIDSFKGSDLAKIREMRGLDLRCIAESTNISRRYLEGIETENFGELPARIYLKGFIATYAEKLGLEGKKVAGDMIARFDELNAMQQEKL